jgi:glycine dehydrogenase subunit 1
VDFVPHTDDDVAVMLEAVGLDRLSDLFDSIPGELRLDRDLDTPGPLAELEVRRLLASYASRNRTDLVCFAGGGAYDHDLPSPVRALLRPEFATSYTPYQPEVAQGVLQGLFEYQSMLCELTGMDVANASLYDGASALVEALNLAAAATGRHEIWMSRGVNPRFRAMARTCAEGSGLTIDEVDTWPASGQPAALVVGQPHYLGAVEDVAAVADQAHAAGALCIVSLDPLLPGLVVRPGDAGADVVVGEGHIFGSPLNFGGPYLGLFATHRDHVRQVPGRIVGRTVDADGRPCFVLTLQAREQHIRREKAQSNVCTNQTLMAIAAAIHLSWLGPQGLRELAIHCARKARYAAAQLTAVAGVELVQADRPFVREFALRLPRPTPEVLAGLADEGFLGGVDVTDDYPETGHGLLVALTEKRTREEIDGLAAALRKVVA